MGHTHVSVVEPWRRCVNIIVASHRSVREGRGWLSLISNSYMMLSGASVLSVMSLLFMAPVPLLSVELPSLC